MKVIEKLRHTFACCFSATSRAATTSTTSTTPLITIKNRLSSTLTDLFNHQHNQDYDVDQQNQEEEEEDQDSLIDAAASLGHYPPSPTPSHHHHHHHRRSTIVGTIYGRRRGHVTFCVQSDPSIPPPFLFELSVPTQLLAKEMNSGILRIALECHRLPHHHHHLDPSSSSRRSSSSSWRAYCNGRKVGYAVRRKPSERDKTVLQTLKSVSAGAGVLFAAADCGGDDGGDHHQDGELLYMRACYERVVGSRDSVSYHLINPAGAGDESPAQELSVFLLRTG